MTNHEKKLKRAKKLLAECGAENLAEIVCHATIMGADPDQTADKACELACKHLSPEQYIELRDIIKGWLHL